MTIPFPSSPESPTEVPLSLRSFHTVSLKPSDYPREVILECEGPPELIRTIKVRVIRIVG